MAPMDVEIQAQEIAHRVIQELLETESMHGEIRSVRVRTYADAEAYRLLGPRSERETWTLHTAINRHLTSGLAQHGIAVEFVVISARCYREWLANRRDGPEARRRYCEIVEWTASEAMDGSGPVH